MPTVPLLASVADLSASQIAGSASQLVPSGVIMPFAGSAAPSGWLFCGGEAVSRSTYASLFSAISTAFGAGDGSTTFNLPDLRGRILAARDYVVGTLANRLTASGSGITSTNLGAAGGTETHTLTTAQLAVHSHGVSDPGHDHNLDYGTNTSSPGNMVTIMAGGTSFTSAGPIQGNLTNISINNAGSGNAHQNTQPTIILNYIIKI